MLPPMPAIENSLMHVIALDGESKTCTSSVMSDVSTHLSQTMHVVTGDAGRFFRTLDHDAQVAMGVDGDIGPPYDRIDEAIGRVIANRTAFDPTIDRGDLERPAIADTVSIVAKRPGVQQAGIQWYESTYTHAEASGAEVFVVNGRNPLDRLRPALSARGQAVALSLLVYCDPEIAARRVLHSNEIFAPTAAEIAAQQAKIEARRAEDRSRLPEDFPYQDPPQVVMFDPDVSPYDLIAMSQLGGALRPYPIFFDTSEMDRAAMRTHAQSLADAALRVTISA